MAIQTKTIKQKMTSVKSIQKITKAMEMISVSKMRNSIAKHRASYEFAEHALILLETLHIHRNLTHPYFETRVADTNKVLMIIIASNKGLCGGYNMNVSKQVSSFIKDNPGVTVEAITIGKQANKIAWRNNLHVVASFIEYSEYFSASEIRSIMHTISEVYDNDASYTSVEVCYTEFISSLRFEPKITKIIPFDIRKSRETLRISSESSEDFAKNEPLPLYLFEPSEQEVLDTIVPRMLMTVVYQMILDSLASEHSSRVTAMRSASDNAGELLENLEITYNRARQAGITQEIAEIVGGMSAVSH
jgi:F-type H+-transporting ATPase subunit gamma